MLGIYRRGLPRLTSFASTRNSPRNFLPNLTLFKQPKMNLMTISQSLNEAYNQHSIIPDVVDQFDSQGLLTIEYNQNDQVTMGNTLSVASTQEVPKIQFTLNSPNHEAELSVKEDDKFILVMTDPDAPSNTDRRFSEYCHWVVSDLKLNSNDGSATDSLSTMLDFSSANEIAPYVGPGPPENTGKHRYVFLFYKQDPQANLVAPPDRPTWGTKVAGSGVRDWIKQHGGKSELLAVNFFYAQNANQE